MRAVLVKGIAGFIMTREEYAKHQYKSKSLPGTWPELGSVKTRLYMSDTGTTCSPVFYPEELKKFNQNDIKEG